MQKAASVAGSGPADGFRPAGGAGVTDPIGWRTQVQAAGQSPSECAEISFAVNAAGVFDVDHPAENFIRPRTSAPLPGASRTKFILPPRTPRTPSKRQALGELGVLGGSVFRIRCAGNRAPQTALG